MLKVSNYRKELMRCNSLLRLAYQVTVRNILFLNR
jgi:hypothetical protein